MDRISDLPDVLLHDILLRLRSPHAAARTSVLSSRWTPYMAILNTEMPCLCTKYVTHIEEMQRYKKVYSEVEIDFVDGLHEEVELFLKLLSRCNADALKMVSINYRSRHNPLVTKELRAKVRTSSITKHGIQLADHRFHQLRAT
ncbi:hypothetical protein EJB05_11901, partial [Eragrostis curvula]